MTYCIAIKTNNRLVFASDSRTNAGPDHVSTYSKMFKWGVPGERQFLLVSAGNLATTQAVVETIERDMKESAAENLLNIKYISAVADYIGRISLEAQNKNNNLGMMAGFNAESTFILGGQIGTEPANIFMIYPQGNHITCPETTPFLQIGEIKYGKPLLDRVITDKTTERDAVRAAMVSMDSTMRSNSTVGPPIEIQSYHINSLQPGKYKIFSANDPYWQLLSSNWAEKLLEAFLKLPELPDFPSDEPELTSVATSTQTQSNFK
ncbi:proteasome-type protease [Cocleimonas flava]|jgi:putative proteasome-type protease|uniref:Putative proteasome-type protease n=1 Tax=Cocleimonas flava TaxID=634765 RepID=A0A4R1EUH5_9GAMM|nr:MULTISPECIES: peptidase [Cocleimonas]MEB8433281.1 proteasome-type protease [Cocleimonas sp. KMM 6892]MEC4717484.1 proteasome-type protease [Cocleimonas sp. KMM 6895]MEC4745199.1 proteasome-type protease [Cocleimonas sp. KMM 6896]TCJ82748.1 putative proteasome-type protease [Cocleimonas flava]